LKNDFIDLYWWTINEIDTIVLDIEKIRLFKVFKIKSKTIVFRFKRNKKKQYFKKYMAQSMPHSIILKYENMLGNEALWKNHKAYNLTNKTLNVNKIKI